MEERIRRDEEEEEKGKKTRKEGGGGGGGNEEEGSFMPTELATLCSTRGWNCNVPTDCQKMKWRAKMNTGTAISGCCKRSAHQLIRAITHGHLRHTGEDCPQDGAELADC